MITDAIAITRGTGNFSKVFNFGTATPAVDITDTDKWMCQVHVGLTNVLTKLNDNAGGDDNQIELDTDADLVTVYLTEKEKNELPDSGYSYKLFRYNTENDEWEVQAYADITASGEAPADVSVPGIDYINDPSVSNNLTGSLQLGAKHNTLFITTPSGPVELTLIGASKMPGKIYRVKFRESLLNMANAKIILPNGNTLLEFEPGDSFEVYAAGADANDWEIFYQ